MWVCLKKPEKHIRSLELQAVVRSLKWVQGTELRSSKGTVYISNCWESLQSFSLNFNMIMIVRPKVLIIISIYILSIPVSKVLSSYNHRWASFHWLWESYLQLQIILFLRYYLWCPLGDTNYLPPHSPISLYCSIYLLIPFHAFLRGNTFPFSVLSKSSVLNKWTLFFK